MERRPAAVIDDEFERTRATGDESLADAALVGASSDDGEDIVVACVVLCQRRRHTFEQHCTVLVTRCSGAVEQFPRGTAVYDAKREHDCRRKESHCRCSRARGGVRRACRVGRPRHIADADCSVA